MVKYFKINWTNVQKEKVRNLNVQFKLDEHDKRILRLLLFNPRLSYREIAKQTKLSVSTVITRIKRLGMSGVLRGFSVDLDAKKLGYDLTAVIEVTTKRGLFLEVARSIAEYPNVYAVYDIAGPCDTVIIAKFRNSEELSKFLTKIQKHPSVVRTETHVVLETLKEDFRFKI